jgi:hypothetical protein
MLASGRGRRYPILDEALALVTEAGSVRSRVGNAAILEFRMLARCPDESIQALTTAAGVVNPPAAFSPQVPT